MNEETMPVDLLATVREHWPQVRKTCWRKRHIAAGMLSAAKPIMIADGNPCDVVVEVANPITLDALRLPINRAAVEWSLEQVLDRPCKVRLILTRNTPPVEMPIPDAFYRSASRQASITNPMRARFRALQLLDTADPDIVNAAALVLMQRYAGVPAMQSFVGDIWCSCMAWAEEWNVRADRL